MATGAKFYIRLDVHTDITEYAVRTWACLVKNGICINKRCLFSDKGFALVKDAADKGRGFFVATKNRRSQSEGLRMAGMPEIFY